MNIIRSRLLLPLLLLGSTAFAHTELAESVPVDGAVLTEAPPALELTFSADVQLLKLDITSAEGVALDLDFTPSATAARTFSIPLPALEPAPYAATWTIVGADGHRVEGELSFLLDATAHEPADAEGEQPDASAHDGH